VLSVPDRPPWQQHARCLGLDPALFYPEPYEDAREAKAVCRECGVRNLCLEWALIRREKHGVWGGESEAGRRRILRRRAAEERDTVHT
jgi:WhiB family redox-sensing transcriptional regulator